MSSSPRHIRALVLDLGTRETGFAFLVGDSLIRYGVRNISRGLKKLSAENIPGVDLIKLYKPDVAIIGKLTHPGRKSNPLLKNLTNQLKQFAMRKEIEVQEIDLAEARTFLNKDRRPTKMNTANLINSIYPELSIYLPQKRRILWTQKDLYWMNMFDALTLALYYLRNRNKGSSQNTDRTHKIT